MLLWGDGGQRWGGANAIPCAAVGNRLEVVQFLCGRTAVSKSQTPLQVALQCALLCLHDSEDVIAIVHLICTVEPPKRVQLGTGAFDLYLEVVLFKRLTHLSILQGLLTCS